MRLFGPVLRGAWPYRGSARLTFRRRRGVLALAWSIRIAWHRCRGIVHPLRWSFGRRRRESRPFTRWTDRASELRRRAWQCW